MSSYIHMQIDSELKKEFQILALQKNTTITQLITDMITDYVNENK